MLLQTMTLGSAIGIVLARCSRLPLLSQLNKPMRTAIGEADSSQACDQLTQSGDRTLHQDAKHLRAAAGPKSSDQDEHAALTLSCSSHEGGHAEDDDGAALQPVHQPVRRRLPRQRDQEPDEEHGHAVVGPAGRGRRFEHVRVSVPTLWCCAVLQPGLQVQGRR
jgi:hypothetical protein